MILEFGDLFVFNFRFRDTGFVVFEVWGFYFLIFVTDLGKLGMVIKIFFS